MNIIKYPNQTEWAALLERPHRDASELRETVQTVLEQIRQGGDAAVKEFELKFDKVKLDSLAVTEVELDEAEKLVSEELKDALKLAHANIEKFHAAQNTGRDDADLGTVVLDGVDACYASQDCWLSGDCALYSSQQRR